MFWCHYASVADPSGTLSAFVEAYKIMHGAGEMDRDNLFDLFIQSICTPLFGWQGSQSRLQKINLKMENIIKDTIIKNY